MLMQAAEPRLLFEAKCSVTGVMCTVTEEEAPFLAGRRLTRTLSLGGHCQSEVFVEADGTLSLAQPLELVQVMLLLSLAWLRERAQPRVVIAGIGGGSLPRALVALNAAVMVTGVTTAKCPQNVTYFQA